MRVASGTVPSSHVTQSACRLLLSTSHFFVTIQESWSQKHRAQRQKLTARPCDRHRASKQGSRNTSSTFGFQSPGYNHVPTLLPQNWTCGSPFLTLSTGLKENSFYADLVAKMHDSKLNFLPCTSLKSHSLESICLSESRCYLTRSIEIRLGSRQLCRDGFCLPHSNRPIVGPIGLLIKKPGHVE